MISIDQPFCIMSNMRVTRPQSWCSCSTLHPIVLSCRCCHIVVSCLIRIPLAASTRTAQTMGHQDVSATARRALAQQSNGILSHDSRAAGQIGLKSAMPCSHNAFSAGNSKPGTCWVRTRPARDSALRHNWHAAPTGLSNDSHGQLARQEKTHAPARRQQTKASEDAMTR